MDTYARLRSMVEFLTEQELVDLVFKDSLTGLWNRRALESLDHQGYYMIVDLDSLKWVNDEMGYRFGDQALCQLAEALESVYPDAVYRVGGDEFVVVGRGRWELLSGMQRLLWAVARSETLENEHWVLEAAGSFSHGVGPSMLTADAYLKENKVERERLGSRSPRGEAPPLARSKRAA